MKSTLITTSVAGGGYLLYKGVTTDGQLDEDKMKKTLTTSLISTGTTATSNVVGETRSKKILSEYAERSASEYVESLSDEELAAALEKLNLLESATEEIDIKSL